MAPDAASSTDPLAGRLVALGRALRLHGIDAGPSELADAAAVITVLGLDDRERLRSGIAAATLHREGQRETFDQVFDIHFPAAVGARTGVPPLEPIARPRDGRAVRARAAALREQLVDALGRLGLVPAEQTRDDGDVVGVDVDIFGLGVVARDLGHGVARVRDAVEVASSITDAARPQVRELTTEGNHSFVLRLDGDRTVVWGAAEDDRNKALALETVLQLPGQTFNISNPELVTSR